MRTETAVETVARIEGIRAEDRTKEQNRALGRAKAAVREEERKRPKGQTVEAPPSPAPRAGEGARDANDDPASAGRSTDAIHVVLDRIRDGIAREVDALLNGSTHLDTADRVKVLTAAAKVTGFADSKEVESIPFVFRGWTEHVPVLPEGVVVTCPSCARPFETTPGKATPIVDPR